MIALLCMQSILLEKAQCSPTCTQVRYPHKCTHFLMLWHASRIGEDGKPTFERTGVVNETPTPPPPENPSRDPWFEYRPAGEPSPAAEEEARRQYDEITFRRREEEPPMLSTSDYTPTVECAPAQASARSHYFLGLNSDK